MSTKDGLLRADWRKLIDIDGESDLVSLQPPVSPARVIEIEREIGFTPAGRAHRAPARERRPRHGRGESLDLASIEAVSLAERRSGRS